MNDATIQWERGLLPRVLDVVADLLELMMELGDDDTETIVMAVLDFIDAFFRVPLKEQEFKYFVAAFRGSFYIWLRAAQGSKNGPHIFGRVSAQATRFTQALAPTDRLRQQTYTDGPWLAMRGSRA